MANTEIILFGLSCYPGVFEGYTFGTPILCFMRMKEMVQKAQAKAHGIIGNRYPECSL